MRPAAGGGDGEEVLQHVSKLVQALHLRPEDVSLAVSADLSHLDSSALAIFLSWLLAMFRYASVLLDHFLSIFFFLGGDPLASLYAGILK